MPAYLIGTLDTKGQDIAFVRDELRSLGVDVAVVDASCLNEPTIAADVSRDAVFEAAGTTLTAVRTANDRGYAVTTAARGVAALITRLHAEGAVDGVIGLGGSAGTTIATAAMRVLPIGVPKVMASTLASGNVRHYVGDKDILMLNTIVDVSGINRISRIVLGEAARAMAGLVTLRQKQDASADKPVIAATMFGVTTPCVERARRVLEAAGYEVLVFHATGTGGQAMESLIADGLIAGVLDITTTELADELVGGVLSAGPDRLTAAGRKGMPQVISVGADRHGEFRPAGNRSVQIRRPQVLSPQSERHADADDRRREPKARRRNFRQGSRRDRPDDHRLSIAWCFRHRPRGPAIRRPVGTAQALLGRPAISTGPSS